MLPKEESCGISDTLWKKIEPLLPSGFSDKECEQTQIDNRRIMETIMHALHNDFKWDKIPNSQGSQNIIYKTFQYWRQSGLFQRMWHKGIITYDEMRTLYWNEVMREPTCYVNNPEL